MLKLKQNCLYLNFQKNDVFKVKCSLRPVFQGPANLVEEGTGFIIRIPVEKLGVIILDINKFKSINDNFGHAVGDIILKDFANKLRAISRNSEKIFRIGGDEFMIICSNVISEEDMKKIKDKTKATLSYTLNIDSNEIKVSANIGYAMFPNNAEKAAEVIKLADKNMYTDKQ